MPGANAFFSPEEAHACITMCRASIPAAERPYRSGDYARCLDECSGLPRTEGSSENLSWDQRLLAETGQIVEQGVAVIGGVADRYIPLLVIGLVALAILSVRR